MVCACVHRWPPLGADNNERDGVYSAFITAHVGSGRYHVSIRASAGSSARVVLPPRTHISVPDLGRLPRELPSFFYLNYQRNLTG